MTITDIGMIAAVAEKYLIRKNPGEKAFSDEEFMLAAKNSAALIAPDVDGVELEDLLERVCKELQTRFTTLMSGSHYLVGHDCHNWLTQERKEEIIKNGYWKSYKASMSERLDENTISKIDEDTDRILGYLADPANHQPQQRKGLVIGNVQSGKTSSYTGLICKAADAGYKIIVVIAGTITTLRSQTQERLERDFVGKSSNDRIANQYRNDKYGVSKYRQAEMPYTVSSLTKWKSDFNKADAEDQFPPNIENGNIVLLVIQKNSRTLENVITYFRNKLSDQNRGILPVLVLDDEADNASPNTRCDDSPSAINKKIRDLLHLFKINTYIGCTATPYANIFINPYLLDANSEGESNLAKQDLFPRDFIYCLAQSNQYIGASRLFDAEDDSAEYNETRYSIQTIGEEVDFVSALKRGEDVQMPDSLKQAINTFVLTRAIRSIRDKGERHCSMLIQVTHKKDGHSAIKALVDDYRQQLMAAVSGFINLPSPEKESSLIASLKRTWDEQFQETEIPETWNDVCKKLGEPNYTQKFIVYKENSSTEKKLRLDYSKDEGVTAIVIGGNRLARGITLEGLCTSYFLRDSKQYDTLMQMGRWFGYRPNYADICRVFITERMQNNFAAIAQATNELIESIDEMREEGKTPLEFGLRVRNSVGGLIVTSKNKMRSTEMREEWLDFSDSLCETYRIPSDETKVKENCQALVDFIKTLDSKYRRSVPADDEKQRGTIWENVPCSEVCAYLQKTRGMFFCTNIFAYKTLEEHLAERHESIDVVLIDDEDNTRSINVKTAFIAGKERRIPYRTPSVQEGDYVFAKNHPFSKTDELGKIKFDEIHRLKIKYCEEHSSCGKSVEDVPLSALSGRYFRRAEGRRPLMLVALMAVPSPRDAAEISEARIVAKKQGDHRRIVPSTDQLSRIVAVYGFSFPKGDTQSQKVRYVYNPVLLKSELAELKRLEEEETEDNEFE